MTFDCSSFSSKSPNAYLWTLLIGLVTSPPTITMSKFYRSKEDLQWKMYRIRVQLKKSECMHTVSNYSPLHFNHVDNKKVFVYVRVCLFYSYWHTIPFLLFFFFLSVFFTITTTTLQSLYPHSFFWWLYYIYICFSFNSKMKLTEQEKTSIDMKITTNNQGYSEKKTNRRQIFYWQ